MESKQEQHVVVIGNPFDGMSIHGPFDTVDDAVAYGEDLPIPYIVVACREIVDPGAS